MEGGALVVTVRRAAVDISLSRNAVAVAGGVVLVCEQKKAPSATRNRRLST